MRQILGPLSIVSTLLLSTGCGGATAAGSDEGATVQDAESYCDARCARSERCNASPMPDCRSSCMDDDFEKSVQHARRDYVRGVTSCVSQLACGEGQDACRESAAEAIGAGPADIAASPEVRECMERQSACGTFKDDVCDYLLLLRSSSLRQVMSCLDEDCDAIEACLDPVFGD